MTSVNQIMIPCLTNVDPGHANTEEELAFSVPSKCALRDVGDYLASNVRDLN